MQTRNEKYFEDDCNSACAYVIHRIYPEIGLKDRILVLLFATGAVKESMLHLETGSIYYASRLTTLSKAKYIKRTAVKVGGKTDVTVTLTLAGKKAAYEIIKTSNICRHPDRTLMLLIRSAEKVSGIFSVSTDFFDRDDVKKVLFSTTALCRVSANAKLHDLCSANMAVQVFLNLPNCDMHRMCRERVYDDHYGGYPYTRAEMSGKCVERLSCQSDAYYALIPHGKPYEGPGAQSNPYDIIIEHDMCSENISRLTDKDHGKLSLYAQSVFEPRLKRNLNMPVLAFTFCSVSPAKKKAEHTPSGTLSAILNTPNFSNKVYGLEIASNLIFLGFKGAMDENIEKVTLKDFLDFIDLNRPAVAYSKLMPEVRQFTILCTDYFGDDEPLFRITDKILDLKQKYSQCATPEPLSPDIKRRIQSVYTAAQKDFRYRDFFMHGASLYCLQPKMYASFTTALTAGNKASSLLAGFTGHEVTSSDSLSTALPSFSVTRPALLSGGKMYVFEDISADLGAIVRMNSLSHAQSVPFVPVFLFSRANYDLLPDSIRHMTDEIMAHFRNTALISYYSVEKNTVIFDQLVSLKDRPS